MASITKRGQSFRVTVSMPDGRGSYIRKTSTYTPPPGSTPTMARRGADIYAIDFERKCKGLLMFSEHITLDELQSWYMNDIAPSRLKASTQRSHTQFYNMYIKPYLGAYKLKQITSVVIDSAFKQIQTNGSIKRYCALTDANALKTALSAINSTYRALAATGIIGVGQIQDITKRGSLTTYEKAQGIADFCGVLFDSLFTPVPAKPFSPNTVQKIQITLSALLSAAYKKGIIANNPMVRAEKIKPVMSERPVLNVEQAKIFLSRLEKLNNHSIRALLLTALFTGLRCGELRALTWNDYDPLNGLIHINKTVDDKNTVTKPKTRASVRYVPINANHCAFLNDYRKGQAAFIASTNGRVTDNGLMFPNTTGGYLANTRPNEIIKTLIAGTDISKNLSIHCLRHSFTSILINGGADVKTISSIIGHANTQTTLNIYSHVFAETAARHTQAVSLALTDGNNIFGVK